MLSFLKRSTKQPPNDPVFEGALPLQDILIPIMGLTGAGKSYFINSLLGENVVEVSNGMASCTAHLQAVVVPFEIVSRHIESWPKDKRLVLVDTPGFDDSSMTDVDILTRLATWLALSYCNEMKLAGIIYLHNIHLRRMTGSAIRNHLVFEDLCGAKACSSVVLGTAQWGTLPVAQVHLAREREEDLRKNYWGEMLVHGSRLVQVDDDQPWAMIEAVNLSFNPEKDVLLMIQDELVNLGKIIPQTTAGRRLRESLQQFFFQLDKKDPSHQQLRELVRKQAEKLDIPFTKRIQKFFRL